MQLPQPRLDKSEVPSLVRRFMVECPMFANLRQVRKRTLDQVLDQLRRSRTAAEMRAWEQAALGIRDWLTHKYSLSKMFLKIEATKVADPRNISPRDLLLQLLLMMFVQEVEAAIKEVPVAQSWAVKGMNLAEVEGALASLAEAGGWAYEVDQSRFDAHVNELLRSVEVEVFAHLFPDEAEHLRWLFSKLWSVTGVSALGVTLLVRYQRTSGEVLTSLGNLIINCFYTWYLFQRYAPQAQFNCKNEGDDSVGVVRNCTPAEFAAAAEKAADDLGLEIDVILHDNLDTAGFLARYFSRDLGTSACDIKRALAKLHVSAKTVRTREEVMSLVKAKAQCYCVTDWSTPCVWAVLDAVLRATSSVEADTNVKEHRWKRPGAVRPPHPPSWEVRCWVERSQGIRVEEQLLFERQFLDRIPAELSYPLYNGEDVIPDGFVLGSQHALSAVDYVTLDALNGLES